MDFYFDAQRKLLIYPLAGSELIRHHIPEAKQINGQYIAVPQTLQNSQTLRWLQWPVAPLITDDNYDWPHAPGITPLEHQKITANFAVAHPRSFVLSDMGCVGGETLIDTAKGKIRIDALEKEGRPFAVRTLTEHGPRYVEVPPPFKKGKAALYKITFKSGRSIVVTHRHVFLTCRGWVSCEHLSTSEQLPVFDVYPQQSNWEPCHVKLLPDAQRLMKIMSGSSGYSDILFYDAPPLSVTDIDLAPPPSLNDALTRTQFEWHTDALGSKYTHTVPFSGALLSKRRCGVQIDRGEMGGFLSEYATKLTDSQFHIYARYHLYPTPLREAREGQELQLCMPLASASETPFDTVTHIAYERTDVYYDMEVPTHENYVAHGLCHHNTMKTLSILWATDWIMSQHEPGTCRAIIVAPLSILQRVWGDAIFRNFLGRRTFTILYGSAEKREKLLAESTADYLVVNFDGVGIGAHTRKKFELDGLSAALAARDDIQIAIVDEASGYRDATTKRHRIAREVIGKRPYLYLMTGTPTPNAPTDAFGLAKMVNNANGKSFRTFQEESMHKVSQFKWVPRKDGYDRARQLLTPAIRFELKDVWNGPEMTTQQREVALTSEQTKAMAELKKNLQIVVKSGQPITAANEAAARQKFIQISLGAVYDSDHKYHLVDASPRLRELEDVIENTSHKVLIFCPLTSVVNLLEKRLQKKWGVVVLNGDVSPKDRAIRIKRFAEDDKIKLCVADPQTTSHGINEMVVADTCVFYGPTDKTELYQQGIKRVHRPGQQYPTTVVQIVSNKLEREIFARLETNTSMQGLLLDMVRKGEI
jgi:SNF2-related domain/Helicase conserved C-terminal domain/Intein splicing domain